MYGNLPESTKTYRNLPELTKTYQNLRKGPVRLSFPSFFLLACRSFLHIILLSNTHIYNCPPCFHTQRFPSPSLFKHCSSHYLFLVNIFLFLTLSSDTYSISSPIQFVTKKTHFVTKKTRFP